MVSTDPVADMLSRIRNAVAAGQSQINLPHSSIKERVAKVLAANGFLKTVSVEGKGYQRRLLITITEPDKPAAITEISRLSRPGRREYTAVKDIPSVKRGRGIVVISTSQGLMTGQEAKQKKLGGELICKVY